MAHNRGESEPSANGLACLSGRQGQRVSRLGTPGFTRRGNQLAQNLGHRVTPYLPKLTHGSCERPAEWRRHGDARQSLFQRLNPATVGPLQWRRIQEQILSDPKRQPERKDSPPLGPPSGLGEEGEQCARRGIPPVHEMLRRSASCTKSGLISTMQR